MAKLRKISIIPGVSWVEAPEVGLYVLCGCPADVVKHLMRRGLIHETEREGVSFETGPNAILLSDVMVQNGQFCNLAEFPVLQMLYRQGMLIPKHPNNRGEKPMLIGAPAQLEAQMGYIHRGNYGLVTKEELVTAGADGDLADELMALKLHFGFGHISEPAELLDAIPLESQPIILKGGVVLRRRELNLFEFSLGDETVTVDLNLADEETYTPPFLLGVHRLEREYFSIIHNGEGDGWDPNRPGMASIVVFQGRIYLIDAGPNLTHSLTSLGIGINEVEGLFHTHCHDDHFAGLTTLLRAGHRIKYYAAPLVRASVMKKLAALVGDDEANFARYFDIRDLQLDQWNQVEGLEVMPLISPHPVETTIMYFRAPWEGGYRSYAHLADIISLDVFKGMVKTDTQPGVSRRFYDKVVADYAIPADFKKLDIGGGMIHGAAVDFARDRSGKLVLAHTARVLTPAEKQIGSGAPFGTTDVVIPGNRDFVWRSAFLALRSYFQDTPHHELSVLLNNPVVVYNPETILVREGQQVEHIHLLISGTVEVLEAGHALNGLLSSGAVIGEMAGIESRASRKTYRALSYVQSLKIPASLYRDFVRRNALLAEVSTIEERRNFLRSTWLCAEALGETTLNILAKGLSLYAAEAGKPIKTRGMLGLVRSGTINMLVNGEVIETLSKGDFFGEEEALLDLPPVFTAEARGPAEIYLAGRELYDEVPVIRWKLLERHRRRTSLLQVASGPVDQGPIAWSDAYELNISRLDHRHRNLVARANLVLGALRDPHDTDAVKNAFGDLVDYTRYHFREEERLLTQHDCNELAQRHDSHDQLISSLIDLQAQSQAKSQAARNGNGKVNGEATKEGEALAASLKEWLVGRVLEEDRHTARILSEKGVS